MSRPPLLAVEAVATHFPVRRGGWLRRRIDVLKAVDGVSFAIQPGEAFGIVGESGSGKSTLARTILRAYRPTSGRIRFDGIDISELDETALRPIRRDMQMVFQDTKSSLNPRLRVEQILNEPLVTHGLPRGRQRIGELLEMVGLGDSHIDRYPHQLSGGQRQRIGIARVLALNPRLIVADEPVSALDVSIQAQILNLLKALQSRLGLTIVLIAHDIGVVGYFCRRVAVMYLGRMVEVGPGRHVTRTPSHPYTQALISAIPRAEPGARRSRILLSGEIPSPIDPPSGCPFHTRCPVKIGPVCERARPPRYRTVDGGWAACHALEGQPIVAEGEEE
ncbi:MAG: ABC transporter ATP-binding protein [Alphaproteobacteria bacterium]|nr:ABC transporter ATP-binding protein [Alphaproteobacteria bacterium]